MSEIFAIVTILVFSAFHVMGVVSHFKQTGWKWVYFTLSALNLIGIILLLTFYNGNLAVDGNGIKNDPPQTETPDKNGGEQKPGTEKPPVKESPSPEDPKAEPENPPPTKPAAINVPENGTIDYQVVKGDTLSSIANRANISVEKIKQWNNLKSDVINVGQILKLYGNSSEPPPAAAPSVIISNGSLKQKEIALTFDAGSDAVGIRILDVLKVHNVKATFFLTGKWVEKFPEFANRIAVEGHEIGNHSYSHPDAVKTSPAVFMQDIIRAEQTIKNATGKSPQPYFRFPYGSYNSSALKLAGEAGYPYSIQWSLDTIDWQQPSAEVIISRIKAGASNGDIILMHIGGINTPDAVDKTIPWLKAQGYQLVTLTEIIK